MNYYTSHKFDEPAITALKTFWQPPLQKNYTPYAITVVKAIKQYTDTCEVKLMVNCLKDIIKSMTVALKYGTEMHIVLEMIKQQRSRY